MSVAILLLGLLVGAMPAAADGPVARTYAAPVERVWAAAEAVLRHLGWDIDRADRAIGFITTESRRLEGEDYGVYAKGTRHRLRLTIKDAGGGRTTVTVERTVFKRERILWMDRDEPVASSDTRVEQELLDALGRAL